MIGQACSELQNIYPICKSNISNNLKKHFLRAEVESLLIYRTITNTTERNIDEVDIHINAIGYVK